MKARLKHLSAALLATVVAAAPLWAAPGTDAPDRYEPVPPKMQKDINGVAIEEKLGGVVPMNLAFKDSTGRDVMLSEFVRGKPVLIQLGYYNCPQICDVVSHELIKSVKDLDLKLGTDFDVLYVSIDPNDRWQLAQTKKRFYVDEFALDDSLKRSAAVSGWNFLVGSEANIKALTDSVGFKFNKVEGRDEYAHPPMLVILTGDGKISRYLYGNAYPKQTMRLGLVEAGEGKVGSYVEQILVGLCYHYDGYAGKYTLAYMNLMRIAGVATVLVIAGVLTALFVREARSRKTLAA